MAEGDEQLQELYHEVLLDYYRSGAHKGVLEPADLRSHGVNPVCGDEVELTIRRTDGGKIGQIRFAGHGCVISQASSAMMAESLEGLPLAKAWELATAFKDTMLGKAPFLLMPHELEALKALEGVRKFPIRIKCATLAWNTLLQLTEGRPKGSARVEYQESGG